MEQSAETEEQGEIYLLEKQSKEMANALEEQFQQTGSLDDLNGQIRLGSVVVDRLPPSHPNRGLWLNNLGRAFGRRFDLVRSMEDLDRAIELVDVAVDATTDDAVRPVVLSNLADQLRKRFENLGSMDDINRAIHLAQMAVNGTPHDDPNRADCVNKLGSWFYMRYNRTGSIDDLNHSIDFVNIAIEATPQDDPSRVGWLNNLGNRLASRFERTDSIDDLSRAIEIANMAVDVTPEDHPNRYIMLNNLGIKLGKRYDRLGLIDDLNQAVDVLDMAIRSIPDNHIYRPAILVNFGNRLSDRYDQTSSIDDLNRAIDVTSLAVEITSPNHPELADWLTGLGLRLGMRFDRGGLIEDLNKAVEAIATAVRTTPPDHSRRAGRLFNLGVWLGKRAARSGHIEDLNHAIESVAIAVETTPADHRLDRASYQSSLAFLLEERFAKTGSTDDLFRAVDTAEMAVAATPKDHSSRASRLNNLAVLIGRQCELTGSTNDLDRAVEIATMAMDSMPSTHVYRATALDNLGNRLGRRYEKTRSMGDLNQAINIVGRAVESTPNNHPYLAGWQNDLAMWTGKRFEETGSMDDLNKAIELLKAAVKATAQDHPERAVWSSNLGIWLEKRYDQTSSAADLSDALSSYMEGWNCVTASQTTRIKLAQQAARILTLQSHWNQASILLEEAVKLLPAVSPRSLKHTDKQYILANFAGLASMAAATALSAGKEASHALQVLELGRGVIASLLLEMRSDISDLQQQHSGLAGEFTILRDELDSPLERTIMTSNDEIPSWELQSKRRREVEQKFGELLTRIRAKPGFHNFLLPPLVEELMTAAAQGPIVVVNLSSYRCDAFLVERHCIRALELTRLTLNEVRKMAQVLGSTHLGAPSQTISMLEWLWNVICRPCLESLGLNHPVSNENWPQVWWVPTGLLSKLPLHAAGYHTSGSTETVLDRVMSSYASSIKVLVYGRRSRVRQPDHERPDSALLVSMPKTPGLSDNGALPFAEDELNMLESLCPALQLQAVKPKPYRSNVLQALQVCKLFHFAGHGQSDPMEPSQSSLLLEDWESNPLTVADLRDHRLQDDAPFLGYLSACWTGANEVDMLTDEGIHLVNAFQLAGFRHVVGTLWEVSDRYCVDVAGILYKTIRDQGMVDVAVCLGLHRALRSLRDTWVNSDEEARNAKLLGFENTPKSLPNLYWVPYVHYGV